MKKELDNKLVNDFPNLYADRYTDMRKTCMCWGFECGNGWFNLICDLSAKLEKEILKIKRKESRWYKKLYNLITIYIDWLKSKEIAENIDTFKEYYDFCNPLNNLPRASQVKEKFGGLRFYISHGNKKMFDLIDEAEEKSYTICEKCGKSGSCNYGGYLSTLCDDCRNSK